MYLKRLTISGFKSFASRTVLELEPGITAVVGPNGSGKSNIADAVRWVLGEQSTRLLRTKKGEEAIFAGTEKRAKASLAEVSLLLDNSNGQAPLDYSEIEISRRLYRSGESEYRLNGRKVTLRDITHLLISAGFGPNTYAVIAQGMIDQLILASPAERKLLFDEASGIRGFEVQREQAVHKLEATEANLVRVRDIVGELEPRLQTLKRGAEAAQLRQKLGVEMATKRAQYLAAATSQITARRLAAQQQITEFNREIAHQTKTIASLEAQRQEINQRPAIEAGQLREAEAIRDRLRNDLSVKQAEHQFLSEKLVALVAERAKLAETEAEFTLAKGRVRQLTHQLAEAHVEESEASDRVTAITKQIDVLQKKLGSLRRQSDQTSRHEYVTHALSILQQVSYSLKTDSMPPDQIRLLVYKAGRLLSHASRGQDELIAEMRHIQTGLMAQMTERDRVQEPYNNSVIRVRSIELDLAHAEEEVAKLSDAQSAAKQRSIEIVALRKQISHREKDLSKLERQIATRDEQVANLRQLADQQLQNQRETTAIFALARELETAKAQFEQLTVQAAAASAELPKLEHEQQRLDELRRDWFRDQSQPKSELSHQNLNDLERELAILEARLNDTASADAEVMDEYQETLERHQFLSDQMADLAIAQTDLGKVVGELDKLIKQKFDSAFAEMSRHFAAYFAQLFDGGKAGLSLRPDSLGNYGIEIKAVPPGKRVESLATLSGGERALTGTALLAAILTINPSPFVVLDEIDAALDEANSRRLAKILVELTKHSQLITITHNRQIMTAAQALYGVTMDKDHSSKVLSVRLETAREMAARQ